MSKVNYEILLSNLQKFNGELCKLYNDNDEYVAKGLLKITIPFGEIMQEYKVRSPEENTNKLEITIKNVNQDIEEGKYIIRSVIEDEDNFLKVELKYVQLNKLFNRFIQKVDSSIPEINPVDKVAYDDFHKELQDFDWHNIKIPEGCKGGDKATKADAFEDMCQEILLRWGAKNFGAIGKGPDRGRDGTFSIEADSWIPISTNYSNSWILQCKYSDNYANLTNVDVYEELVKVLMHRPDYFLLMTNRKVTSDFSDWLDSLKGLSYHIPFKVVFIGKELLEEILAHPTMIDIREKYF